VAWCADGDPVTAEAIAVRGTIAARRATERGILFKGRLVNAIAASRKTQTRRLAVPGLRVRPRHVVRSDLMPGQTVESQIAVGPLRSYAATIGDAGAVSAVTASGERLGLKPGEFDLVCPYADGRTYLDNGVWRIDVAPDQRLWVRETWSPDCRSVYPCPDAWYRADFTEHDDPTRREHGYECKDGAEPRADCFACAGPFRWRPAIHMPKARARYWLTVESVKLERLLAITEADAIAEGLEPAPPVGTLGGRPMWLGAWSARTRATGSGPLAFYSPRDAFGSLWDSINEARAPWDSNPWVWAVTFRRHWR
jgi:hypothetical protein